ncbi:MAG: hypothetical protein ABJV04_02415 [Aliiglaciecola sp.]|uniref:hypothetical protein n=1 Tax=Aliiglaciecola sp. TaxID=1872441 RepID=UPI003296C4A7
MVDIEGSSTIITTIALLMLFMYFAANLAMVVLEKRISVTSLKSFNSGIVKILNKKGNPQGYKQARIYLCGSILSLFAFMAFLGFGYA